jgi:hypothetical protein
LHKLYLLPQQFDLLLTKKNPNNPAHHPRLLHLSRLLDLWGR